MAYSKDEVKAITDKVLNMCKADAVEIAFSGGERSATRFANSSITANLVEQGGVGRSEGVDHTCVRGSDHALVAHDWRIADLARGHTP